MSEAAARVKAALESGAAPSRKDLEQGLRECFGLSVRRARAFCADGIKALGEVPAEDEVNEQDLAELGALLTEFAKTRITR